MEKFFSIYILEDLPHFKGQKGDGKDPHPGTDSVPRIKKNLAKSFFGTNISM